jgi:potassium-transporting ATPase KdpC subunit
MPASVIRPALTLLVVLTALTGVAYPLLVTGLARVALPQAAGGSLIVRAGTPVASRLIGQNFTGVQYFWGRPSATTPYPYNATASGGSNLGPLNPALADAVKRRVTALRAVDPGNQSPVPVDLVTASGSGLDPEVSLAAIQYQLPRVARARKMAPERLQGLVARYSKNRLAGFLGEPRANVVELNLALDELQGTSR